MVFKMSCITMLESLTAYLLTSFAITNITFTVTKDMGQQIHIKETPNVVLTLVSAGCP